MPGGLRRAVMSPVVGFLSVLMGIGGGSFGRPADEPLQHADPPSGGHGGGFLAFSSRCRPWRASCFWTSQRSQSRPYTVGAVNVPSFLLVIAMTLLTAPIGVKLAHSLDPKPLKRVFAGFPDACGVEHAAQGVRMVDALLQRGWCRFAEDAAVRAWAEAALPAARVAMHDPAQAHWWQCEDTWFVGVDALDNDARGAVAGGPSLCGAPVSVISEMFGVACPRCTRHRFRWCGKGIPSRARARVRRRSAIACAGTRRMWMAFAPKGAARRRRIAEPHMFILGLPLTGCRAGGLPRWCFGKAVTRSCAPVFATALADHKAEDWGQVDITEAYVAARREVFETSRAGRGACCAGRRAIFCTG